MTIEFSIIVPAYNAAATLPGCLNALLHQSIDRARYEIIVVDDGSRDQTAAIAESILGPQQARVIRAAHGGPAQARNIGAQTTQGQLILFTDADCEPVHGWIERMAAAFNDPLIAGAKGVYQTRQKSLVARFVQQEYQDKCDRMLGQPSIDFIDTYSAGYRRSVFLDNQGFDPTFIVDEDQELSFRLAALGLRLVFAPEAIVGHRHVTSPLKYLRRKFTIGYWKALVLRRHPDKVIKDSHTPQSIKIQIALLAGAIVTTLLAVWLSDFAVFAIGAWLLLFITMLPLLRKIARRDAAVLWIAPWLIGLRALGLGAGLAAGLIRFNLFLCRKQA